MVGRFYTYVCKEKEVYLANFESRADVLRFIEDAKMVQGHLKKIAEGGRKMQSVQLCLLALHKF